MQKNNIEVIRNESGDWKVLLINGNVEYEGHSIPDFIWMNTLIEYAGFGARLRTITDEEMEEQKYEQTITTRQKP